MKIIQESQSRGSNAEFKTIGTKVRLSQLPIMNQRLKIYGFDTIGQLIHDFINAKFPPIYDEDTFRSMKVNLQSSGQFSVVNSLYPSFLDRIDYEDLLKFYLSNLKLQNKNGRDLVSDFRRYSDLFFGSDPSDILKFSPHKRSWILQAMKKFTNYYYFKTGNNDCKDVVSRIIDRFNLNVSLDMKQAIYIVDHNFVENKIKTLMSIQGEIGFIIKVGLFSGLREDENNLYSRDGDLQ